MRNKPWYLQNSSQLFFFPFFVFSIVKKLSGSVLDIDAPTPLSSYNAFKMMSDRDVRSLSEDLKVNGALTILNVSFKNIGDSGAAYLSEALKVNGTLTWLLMNSNNIGDSGAAHLSEALKVNGTLTRLDVSSNNIGDSGAAHLSEARKLNRRLTFDVQDHLGFPLQGNVRSFSKKVIPNSEER